MNRGIKVLQTSALPLGYVAGLARVAGFEPAHDGIRIRCLTAWRYPNAYLYCLTCLQMGWIVGFEPTYTGATTLGLNHLTIPTMLVNFAYCCVAVSLVLGYVHRYAPFGTCSTRLALRKISCAYKFVRLFFFKKELATWNGLEPSTSSVTGWHSNQLNYRTAFLIDN